MKPNRSNWGLAAAASAAIVLAIALLCSSIISEIWPGSETADGLLVPAEGTVVETEAGAETEIDIPKVPGADADSIWGAENSAPDVSTSPEGVPTSEEPEPAPTISTPSQTATPTTPPQQVAPDPTPVANAPSTPSASPAGPSMPVQNDVATGEAPPVSTPDEHPTVSTITINTTTKAYLSDNGSTLDEVVQNLRWQDYEYHCGFDYQGAKLFDYTNQLTNHVYSTRSMRREFANLGGTVVVHNHPSGSAFSGQDLYAEALFNTPCIIAVGQEYVYVLRTGASGWSDPSTIKQYWQNSYDYHLNYANDYITQQGGNYSAPTGVDDGSFEWFYNNYMWRAAQSGERPQKLPYGLWVSHAVMRDVAGKFQLNYQRYAADGFSAGAAGIF